MDFESEEFRMAVFNYLLDNLSVEVETNSVYNGGDGSGSMYRDSHKVILVLQGNPIASAYLD